MTYAYPRIYFSWNTGQRNQEIICESFTVKYMENLAEIGPISVETQAGNHFLIKICDEYPYPSRLDPNDNCWQLEKLHTFLSNLVREGLLETTNEITNANAHYPSVTYKVTQSWRRVVANPLEFSEPAASPQQPENPPDVGAPANDGHDGNPLSNNSQFVTNPYLLLLREYPQALTILYEH